MQKPAYKVKIGSEIFESAVNQEIISISVDLDIDVPSDSFRIALKPGIKASALKNGDTVVIELGYEGGLGKVLTGAVDTIEPRISEHVVSGYSAVSILTGTRINQVYENQTSGAIVKDIADKAGIAVKEAQDGLSFPMYVVDDTRDCYTHMRELARRCGFDLFLTGDGRLIFRKYERKTPRPFKYGRDIIESVVYEPTPMAACVKVYGESPASFKGADTSHWLTKKVVEGVAGSGDMIFLIEDLVIKDTDTADKVAISFLETIMTPLSGTLKSIGNSRVGPGDTIEIKDMPNSRMNGEFEATSISHTFNKTEGFISSVGWVKKIQISPAALPLAAPPPLPAPPKPPSPLEEQVESAKGELEDKRLQLQEAVETAEMELEKSLFEINIVISELDKIAKEMITAAEEAKKAAMEAVKEALAKVDELKKELEEKKKEIEDGLAQAKAKVDELKNDAYAQIEKYEQELLKLKKEAEKGIDKIKSKVDEVREKAQEKVNKLDDVSGKLGDIEIEIEDKKKKLDDSKEEVLNKSGPAKEALEKRITELESSIDKSKEKIESLKKETQELKKEADGALDEVKKKEEEIEKEIEDKKKEVDEKIKEVQDKKEEIKKSIEDAEKEYDTKVGETKKKIEEVTKEIETQIGEAKKTAEKIEKEADEKLSEAKKKVEATKKEALDKLESVKKVYNEAREKVMEARKQAGMD